MIARGPALLALALVLSVLAPAQARAQTPAATPAADSPHRFFVDVSLGPGLLVAWNDAEDTRRFLGGAVAFQGAVGGRIRKTRFVVAAAYRRDQYVTMTSEDDIEDGDEPDLSGITFSYDRLGVLIAYYPFDEPTLHFEGFAGYGDLNAHRPRSAEIDDPSGFVATLGGGYGVMMNPNLKLGATLRLGYSPMTASETASSVDITALTFALAFGVTYH